jgi:hypothetical protein
MKKLNNPKELDMKFEEDYNPGTRKVYRAIKKREELGLSTTDLDIGKATRLAVGTVWIYRTILVKDGFVKRSANEIRKNRKRMTWKCVKTLRSKKDQVKTGLANVTLNKRPSRSCNESTTSNISLAQYYRAYNAGKKVVLSVEKLLNKLNKDLLVFKGKLEVRR